MDSPNRFDRNYMLERINFHQIWDVLIIGGGATGLGTALDAASRGCSTILFEQQDFCKGTSSRSTKLVHGGVRYLAQGNIKLVYGALHERGILLKNAPHVVKPLTFIIPCYSTWEKIKYTTGLKFYDLLSGQQSFGRSTFLNREKVIASLPNINPQGLKGGVQYFDGQFDDARLAINIAQTAAEHNAVLLNYFKVSELKKSDGKITGVTVTDQFTNLSYTIHARSVINATGIFVDEVLRMDNDQARAVVTTSQGVHIVVSERFLPFKSGLMIPKTSDGRVLFAVPWHGHLLIGTTDTLLTPCEPLEPVALEKEIQFLLDTAARFLVDPPTRKEVLSVFAGLRPLAASNNNKSTKEISRDHKLIVSPSGMVTITGGKWTTYRKMAEDSVNAALHTCRVPAKACITEDIRLHGYLQSPSSSHLSVYGSDEENIRKLIREDPSLATPLAAGHPYTAAEVIMAVRHEMAVTVEDVLARRIRLLFLDARAAISAAPMVAELMMKELHLSEDWKQVQLQSFRKLALHYLIN